MSYSTQRPREWLDLLAFAVICAPLLIFLLGSYWPHALDGRDVLEPAAHGNYLRNSLELTSFAATTLVLITAIVAFRYSNVQLQEAKAARLAALYATLEARWSSADMIKSKAIFAQITLEYPAYAAAQAAQGATPPTLQAFAHGFIRDLRQSDREAYFRFMALPEYLEYIGMLTLRGYLKLDDIDDILGTVTIDVATVLSDHIDDLRAQSERNTTLPNAPMEFHCLTDLAEKFVRRYRATASISP